MEHWYHLCMGMRAQTCSMAAPVEPSSDFIGLLQYTRPVTAMTIGSRCLRAESSENNQQNDVSGLKPAYSTKMGCRSASICSKDNNDVGLG